MAASARAASVSTCAQRSAVISGRPPRPIPSTFAVPANLALPADTTIYATSTPESGPFFVVGPTGYACTALWSADGAVVIGVHGGQSGEEGITATFDAGGVGPNADLACPYIPTLRPTDAAIRGNATGLTCPASPQPQERVSQLPTGSTHLLASAVRASPHTSDPGLEVGTNLGSDEALAVFAVRLEPDRELRAQADSCALPAAARAICATNLAMFLATSEVGTHQTPAALASMIRVADTFLTGSAPTPAPTSTPGGEPPCRTAEDLSLEHELHKYATQRIPIPANTIKLPAGVDGGVTVAFELGGAQICRTALTPGLPTPGLYTSGELAIDASGDTGTHYGPFKYEVPTVSWLPDPSMPSGQELTTHFAPLSAEASLNVHPSFSFGSVPALTVADAQLHALSGTVTLVKDGQAQLQVGLGLDPHDRGVNKPEGDPARRRGRQDSKRR